MISMAIATLAPPLPASPFVLVADDDEDCLDVLRRLVEMTGRRCVTAGCGAEALAVCDRRRPSLIVTDLTMPRLDGIGLARAVRARFATLPIVLVTGQDLADPALRPDLARFNATLPKPLEPCGFLTLITSLMAGCEPA